MKRIAALIFDVEGTLAETEEVRRRAINEALRRFHFPWALDRLGYSRLVQRHVPSERLKRYVAELTRDHDHVALELLPEISAEEERLYTKMVESGEAPFRPGVKRLIEEAKAYGARVALVSSSSRSDVETLLIANLEMEGVRLIDTIIAAEDAAPKDVYRLALGRMKVDPDDCVAFEDSAICLKKAIKSGVRTVVTPSLFHEGDEFTGALAVLSHLGESLDPYEYIQGAGMREQVVTMPVLERWLSDDDDMRGLLTIGGRSLF